MTLRHNSYITGIKNRPNNSQQTGVFDMSQRKLLLSKNNINSIYEKYITLTYYN